MLILQRNLHEKVVFRHTDGTTITIYPSDLRKLVIEGPKIYSIERVEGTPMEIMAAIKGIEKRKRKSERVLG